MTAEPQAGTRPVLLDMDVGVDDALALCLAMRSPEIDVVGIAAVHGNVPVELTATNALRTLDVLGGPARPPVAIGARTSLDGRQIHADDVHGRDGLGGATTLLSQDGKTLYPESLTPADGRSATEMIHALVAAHPSDLTLVATGPLTNVAEAVHADPGHMRALHRIVAMGGTFRREGNMSPVAEFNVFADPDAARVVFEAGIPLTLVPLDVTEQVVLDRETVNRNANAHLGRFVRDVTDAVMDFGARIEGIQGMYVHDALAVACVIDSTLFRTVDRLVRVETTSPLTMGQTIADLREPERFGGPPNAAIAVEVDGARFLSLLVQRVFGR